jgi:hypothetical protein
MITFFKPILSILIITLLLMFFLDYTYSYAFKTGQPRSKIQNILQLKNQHYDIAFFGSSRTEQHVDCKLISRLTGKSCINFGISGGLPGDMLILMKLAKDKNISFDQVFMQVDYNYNSLGISEYFKANLVPFMNNSIIKEQLLNYNEVFYYRWIPFYRFMIFDKVVGIREAVASFLKLRVNTNINIGFSPNRGIGTEVPEKFSFPESIKDKNYEIAQMQELYKNTKTSIKFFTAPYCKNVRNRESIEKVQEKLPRLHNYIDLFDDKDEYFFNCGHLNENGARIFTKTLVEDLLL